MKKNETLIGFQDVEILLLIVKIVKLASVDYTNIKKELNFLKFDLVNFLFLHLKK